MMFALASIFWCSTSLHSMENKAKNLTVLAKKALSDGNSLKEFCDLCDGGSYDHAALVFLIKQKAKLENKHHREPILAGDEIYSSNSQSTSEILTHFTRSNHIEQMIKYLKESKNKQ